MKDPARKRAAGGKEFRRRGNGVGASFLRTGQPGLAYLRYIVVGDVAWYRCSLGGLGAVSSNLGHLSGLSIVQNAETFSRFERSRGTAWARPARDTGDFQIRKGELVMATRERLHQWLTDQLAEFTDRSKAQGAPTAARLRPKCPAETAQESPTTGELPTSSGASSVQSRSLTACRQVQPPRERVWRKR